MYVGLFMISQSSTLKIEAADYSETLLHMYQTSKHHIPEDRDMLWKTLKYYENETY
jgi:hypothetical protein